MLFFQVFAFAHHAWAREAKRGDETGNGSNCGSIENGAIENGSSASSGSGGDEGYGDDQVTIHFIRFTIFRGLLCHT